MGPRSCWYQSAGLRLHYADWSDGDADDPVVIFVHGGRDHAGCWESVIEAVPRNWAIFAPDLRGHGDSDWSPGGCYTPWDYATDLDALVRTVRPEGQVFLVGHSLGGAVSLQYAGARPDRVAGVLVIEPFGMGRGLSADTALYGTISQDVIKVTPVEQRIPAPDRIAAYMDAVASLDSRTMPTYASIDEAIQRMIAANPRVSPEIAERVGRNAVRETSDGRFAWKFDNRVRLPSPYSFDLIEASEIWQQITAPVYIINGAESRPGPAKQSDGFEGFFRDLTITTVEDASHFVQIEQPRVVAKLLTDFVRDVGSRGTERP